ncbi:cupredoxin domain-containing protein [Promicromonospora sp. CA-289599]|uniref:cupredoxin domain-containing protein n=1 Tax=Promicromonospora sp. CA-289599 TaxID=3240014 RepID=UPI003D92666B
MAGIVAAAAATLVATATMAGCAGTDAPPATAVVLDTDGFDPVSLETAAGSEVRFVNRSERPQELTSLVLDDGTAAVPQGAVALDSGRLVAGATYAARFEIPGEYVVEAVLAPTGTPAVVTIRVEESP